MLTQADLFYGASTPQRATLYVRLPRENLPAGATLRGTVSGPECTLAETLPSRVELRDLGEGETLLAHAVLPDPVFWSPKLPARYRVRFELCQGGTVLASDERLLGIRALGAVGTDLRLEGKRVVLRMIHRGEAPTLATAAWREQGASMLAVEPDDELCEEASRIGVLLAVLVQGDADAIAASLRRLARHAAVAAAIVDGSGLDEAAAARLHDTAPNLLLFQPVSPDEHLWRPAPWAQGVMAPVLQPAAFALGASGCEMPVLAARPFGPTDDLAPARAACDRLQADLAPYCQCAGYIV